MDCDDGSMDCWDDEAFIAIANELIDKCNLPGKVSRLEECRDNFFVGVYRGLVGDDLSGIIENPISVEQHIQNCQTVIDLVATDVLNVDLSHISGKGIVEGDKASIRNFLEIFAGLLEYFMECIDDKDSDDEHDSNLLTSEHDIISGVLREEFGPSYQAMYESRPRQSREEPKQLSEKQGQGQGHNRSLTRSTATAADSTACDADTSKLSDSRAGGVSDSTAELIRLGETSTDRSSDRKEPRDYLPDSTSSVPGPSALPPESSSVFSSNVYGDGEKGRKSVGGSGRSMSSNALNSQRAGSQKRSGNLASRDTTSAEDELTQYTLTPTELGDSSAAKAKSAHKNPKEPSPSFLSDSSTSAAWPEQISPLEPLKDSIRGGPGQFDALGVRPKEPPHSTGDTDSGSQVSSGRSTPVYHHYHHHFHHTQPQGRVPAFQSAAEMSAAASVDIGGPTNHLSRSDPTEPVTRAAQMLQNRLTQTTPNALTYPLSGSVYPSTAIPRSTAISSTQGLTHPPPAGVTGTTSTLTDSVFLSGSASSRTPVVTPSATGVASGAFVATSSLRDRLAMSTATKPSTGSSVPTSSSLPSTSYRPPGTTGSSVDERASVMERANKLADRLNSLSRGQSLASTFPERSSDRPQTRVTDLEPPIVPRYAQSTDPCLLANYSGPEADDNGSDGEREPEDEELAQNSDSAVDYGRISSATGARMRGKASLSRSSSRTKGRTETPRIPRAYKESTEDSSSERPPRRGVTFRDTVETFPVSGRMDRLRRLLYDEAEEKRKRHTKDMRKAYRDQLREIQQEQEREKASHQKRKMPVSPNVPKKKPKKKSPVKKNGGLQAVYRSQVRKFRPVRKTSAAVKERKRSASASPVRSRRTSDSTDHPDVLLPAMLEEFPFLHVSPQTARSMWQKQAQHLSSVFKSESEAKRTKTQRMIEEAERRQEALVGILKKDLDHNLRMREKQERQQQQRTVRAKLREKRQVSARARRYYDEYELRMRARMLKRRTQEEQIFKRVFEDGLDIQKQRIRELREYAKEKREALAQRQQNEIESLENFYRDQFAMLAEGIARERFEMEVREKAQEKVVRQMRKDLRHKLERDVKEFQENLQRDEDSAYFRQLDADRLRGKFQLATRSAFY